MKNQTSILKLIQNIKKKKDYEVFKFSIILHFFTRGLTKTLSKIQFSHFCCCPVGQYELTDTLCLRIIEIKKILTEKFDGTTDKKCLWFG